MVVISERSASWGSDVYDKLLILQALRPELPEALFFTTDLDELLLPQDKTRYTRNLLVASSYDLTLDDDLQADIPRFRNIYQTSIFITTRVAIEKTFPETSPDPADPGKYKINRLADSLPWAAPPALFQIGRTAPQALPTATRTGNDCSKPTDPAKEDGNSVSWLGPTRPDVCSLKSGTGFAVFSIPLVLIGMVFPQFREGAAGLLCRNRPHQSEVVLSLVRPHHRRDRFARHLSGLGAAHLWLAIGR